MFPGRRPNEGESLSIRGAAQGSNLVVTLQQIAWVRPHSGGRDCNCRSRLDSALCCATHAAATATITRHRPSSSHLINVTAGAQVEGCCGAAGVRLLRTGQEGIHGCGPRAALPALPPNHSCEPCMRALVFPGARLCGRKAGQLASRQIAWAAASNGVPCLCGGWGRVLHQRRRLLRLWARRQSLMPPVLPRPSIAAARHQVKQW